MSTAGFLIPYQVTATANGQLPPGCLWISVRNTGAADASMGASAGTAIVIPSGDAFTFPAIPGREYPIMRYYVSGTTIEIAYLRLN